jgi:virginiamycin B lyase
VSVRAARVAVALVAAVIMVGASGAFAAVGDINTFSDPAGNVSQPEDITTGPDGALWFTNFANGRIGRITPAGDVTTFTDHAGDVALPRGITAGPGTDVWFASTNSDRIGRIATTGPQPAPPEPVVAAPRFTG